MAICQNSTHFPKNQPSLFRFSLRGKEREETDACDPALELWRIWRDAVLTERESSPQHYIDRLNARSDALAALKQCRQTTPAAIAARLHAAFFHAYPDTAQADRRDPVYQAEAAMLRDLLPSVPDDLAADITATLNGLGLAGEA